MPKSDRYLPRRTLLATATSGLVLFALAGCWADDDRDDRGPDQLEPLLASAIYLAERYQGAIAAFPNLAARLTPLGDAHGAHVEALKRELGLAEGGTLPSPRQPGSGESSAEPPNDPQAAITTLRELERSGQRQAAELCLAGPGYRAALVGSIAAARACHAEALG